MAQCDSWRKQVKGKITTTITGRRICTSCDQGLLGAASGITSAAPMRAPKPGSLQPCRRRAYPRDFGVAALTLSREHAHEHETGSSQIEGSHRG